MADISTDIAAWSATAGSNSPAGATSIGTGLDDNLRAMQAAIVAALNAKGADKASSGTVDLSATDGLFHDVTGTTTITAFGTVRAGVWKVLKFEGALTLTHNATSLILPGGANITTANGDIAIVVSEGSGNWRCVHYQGGSFGKWLAIGTAGKQLRVNAGATAAEWVDMSPITNSLGADVALSSTGTYFTGPTIAQGTSGVWFASGTITVVDPTNSQYINVKLWDGTTVIASSRVSIPSATVEVQVALSGYISAPAGNIRISASAASATTASILFNNSGNSKDSTVSAIRIA